MIYINNATSKATSTTILTALATFFASFWLFGGCGNLKREMNARKPAAEQIFFHKNDSQNVAYSVERNGEPIFCEQEVAESANRANEFLSKLTNEKNSLQKYDIFSKEDTALAHQLMQNEVGVILYNPLQINDRIRESAEDVTKGETKDLNKAWLLYKDIRTRLNLCDETKTAIQLQEELDTSGTLSGNCDDISYFFVVRLRSIGIPAFPTIILKDDSGRELSKMDDFGKIGKEHVSVWFRTKEKGDWLPELTYQNTGDFLTDSAYLGYMFFLEPQKRILTNDLEAIIDFNDAVSIKCMSMGQLDTALKISQALNKLKPDDPGLTNNFGAIYLERGELELAEVQFRKAIDLDSNAPIYYLNLAQALLKQRKFDEAIASIETSIRLNPNNYGAFLIFGDICFEQSDNAGALRNYEKAAALNSTCYARDKIAEIKSLK